MYVNNLPKVATQWNSGATQESNRGHRVRIPSVLTTRPLSHTTGFGFLWNPQELLILGMSSDTNHCVALEWAVYFHDEQFYDIF